MQECGVLVSPLLPDLATTLSPLQLMALSLIPCADHHNSVLALNMYIYHEQSVYQVLVVL